MTAFAYTTIAATATRANNGQGHFRRRETTSCPTAKYDAVVKYLFAKDVGKGPATYEDCVDFWGKDTKQCDPMKK